jgi:hypothetical protein
MKTQDVHWEKIQVADGVALPPVCIRSGLSNVPMQQWKFTFQKSGVGKMSFSYFLSVVERKRLRSRWTKENIVTFVCLVGLFFLDYFLNRKWVYFGDKLQYRMESGQEAEWPNMVLALLLVIAPYWLIVRHQYVHARAKYPIWSYQLRKGGQEASRYFDVWVHPDALNFIRSSEAASRTRPANATPSKRTSTIHYRAGPP